MYRVCRAAFLLAVFFPFHAAAAAITISLSPTQSTVLVNQTQDFVAVVTGTTNKNVKWKVCDGNGQNCVAGGNSAIGTIIDIGADAEGNGIGRYTAPAQVPSPPSCLTVTIGCQVTIKAKLIGRKKKASAPVILIAGVTVNSLSPSTAVAGGAEFDLVVGGGGFLADSVVQWNGSDRVTLFNSSAQLTATILAADIATAGVAQVTVFNPSEGMTSNPLPFVITSGPVGVLERVSVSSDGIQGNASSGGFFFGGSFVAPSLSGDGRFVAFLSAASNLVTGDTNGELDIFVRDTCVSGPAGCTPSTDRVSVASDGTQGNGESGRLSISANGRFVAFRSQARNLVADDTNAQEDVFVRDTCVGGPAGCTPSTIRVSVASNGTQVNSFSFRPSISADGRLVAFTSAATTMVPGDTNGKPDIFVRDTCAGGPLGCTPSTVRVSVASDGTQGNDRSDFPSLSADGRFVAFESEATNLVPGDTNGVPDIFLRDTCVGGPAGCTPSTHRVSVASDGSQGNGFSFESAAGTDGRFVAFDSLASNLVAGDSNERADVFVRDTCQGAPSGCTPSTTLVSVGSDGAQGNNSSHRASISADGHFVAFYSFASNLVAGDSNAQADVFVRDTCQGAPSGCTPSTIRVSVASNGTQGNNLSHLPSLSADGRLVVFISSATNLVAGDTNGAEDVFLAATGR